MLLIITNASATSKKDSLLNVIKHGTPIQKTSAFYRLASKTKNFKQAIVLYDSAEYYYNMNPNDTDLMYINGFKSMTYSRIRDFNKAIKYSKNAVEIGIRIDKKKDVAAMYNFSAKIYKALHQYDSAIALRVKSIPIYTELLNEDKYSDEFCYSKLAKNNLEIGKLYFFKKRNDVAIKYLYYAIELYEKMNDIEGIAECHLNIGNVFNFEQSYDKAEIEYQKGLEYAKISNNIELINVFLTNIGTLYLNKSNYDSANYYFDLSLKYALLNNGNLYKVAGLYNNKAIIKKHLQEYDSALYFFNKSLEYYNKINNTKGKINTQTNIGSTLVEMKRYSEAEKLFKGILGNSLKYHMNESSQEIYLGLSKIYTEQKRYKQALAAFKKHIIYYDSLNSVKVRNSINKYREQYEAEKKDQAIKLLEQKAEVAKLMHEKQAAAVKRQRLIAILLIIIIIFLIISIVFIRRYFQLRQKAAQELIKKNAEINQQKIVDLVKEQEVKSINSFMSGQEKERNRIAAELHDRLGSLLSAVKLHFSSIEADIDESNQEERENFSFALKLLDNSVEEVRSISHNLSKGILMKFGLSEAVKNLRDTINTAGQLQIKFIEAGPGYSLKPDIEVELFRIIQELITNSIKHSQADEIFVQLISDDEGLRIVVEDNGVGFNIRKLKGKGIGLINMKSRVEKFKGEYHIESSEGNGTTVIIEVKNNL